MGVYTDQGEQAGGGQTKGKLWRWDPLLPLPPVLPQKWGPLFIPDMLGFCVRLPLRKSSLMKINESDNHSFLGLT